MTDEAKMIVDALNNCSICDSDCIIDAVDLIKVQEEEIEKQKQIIADLESALNQSEFEAQFWQTISESQEYE